MAVVLHIALNDQRNEGARLLHEALLLHGVQSELWVFEKTTVLPYVFQIRSQVIRHETLLTPTDWDQIRQGRNVEDFDKIIVHGLGNSIPSSLLAVLSQGRFYWSIMDCAPYTGGCHHSAHCQQWRLDHTEFCAACPEYAGKAEMQRHQHDVLVGKRDVYARSHMEFFCQNTWQEEQLRQSVGHNQPTRVLPALIDRDSFYPGSRQAARHHLGLPENAFVLVMPVALGNGTAQVADYVQKVLRRIRASYCGYVVLVFCGGEIPKGEWAVDEVRSISMDVSLRGEYYRAADLQLYFSGLDITYQVVREAGWCVLPSAVFDLGAAHSVLSEDTGFFVREFDIEQLSNLILMAMKQSISSVGMRFFVSLQTTPKLSEWLDVFAIESQKTVEHEDDMQIFASGDARIRSYLQEKGKIWQNMPDDAPALQQDKKRQQHLFVDSFCLSWLRSLQPQSVDAVWRLLDIWIGARGLSSEESFTERVQADTYMAFCYELRSFLVKYFQCTPLEKFAAAAAPYTDSIAKVWYFIFLNTESVVNRARKKLECPPSLLYEQGHTGYPLFLIWSMFTPSVPRRLEVSLDKMMVADLPMSLRIITAFWLMTAPLYNGTQQQQQAVFSYISEMCRLLRDNPELISPSLRIMYMDRMMISLWRLSYYGGNNIGALRSYGDYLQVLVQRDYSQFSVPVSCRRRKPHEKLRIGYISTNFRHQAVPQYMANRLKYADHHRFWIKSFVLELICSDEMTRQICEWSDASETIVVKDASQIRQILTQIASVVRQSDLDLLVYTDIGMNNVTYMLGAMQLAPVQAVLVGHGTTTGLTTIDYYVSGDHEPADAEAHYTEKLVRLPNAGAAQMPPSQTAKKLTREQFGIPDDAVLFISCANGLKHIPERDALLVEILCKAPQAYILLKPFMGTSTVDWKLRDRILGAAQAAGVADRLKIIPPLPDSGDLMPLIQMADVQLDTYPYGGWTTNLEAIYYHLPIVTQQGDMARSRWGARLLESMGIREGIDRNPQEYAAWAVRYAQDEELRHAVAARIAERAEQTLFNGKAAQPAYEAALVQMIKEKEARLKKNRG